MLSFIAPAYAASEPVEGETAGGAPGQGGPDASGDGHEASGEAREQYPAGRQPRTRETRAVRVSLADAAVTAEMMYYCGELFLFADGMIKINYEMAAIAAGMKDALQSGSLLRSRAVINSMNRKYNAASEIYNSWIDVKGDLEFFIDTVGARNVYTKTQLQIAFSRTLAAINETKAMLEAAGDYYEEQTADAKRTLTGYADKVTASAAGAAGTIAPSARQAIDGYRAMFDLFAKQAGIEPEYKTWSNPELAD